MPFFLIRINNKRTWDREAYSAWLEDRQAPADVFRDFRVSEGTLSVWHVADDRSNLRLIVSALAATRDSFDVFDYGMFDQELVRLSNIEFVTSDGDTPMPSANKWHRDLTLLTTGKLSSLATTLFDVLEKGRVSKRDVRDFIVAAAKGGEIVLSSMKDNLRRQILDDIDRVQ